ncbi:NACHT domain-containing protein [Streptomyces montanus]|nr:NACHT domain-containing protein [Streptomyces montanus]
MTGSVQGGIHVHLHPGEWSAWSKAGTGVSVAALTAFGAGLLLLGGAAPWRVGGAVLLLLAAWQAIGAWRAARDTDLFLPDERLDAAATVLASRLRSVYDREERLSRIHDPVPLRVRWAEGDPLLADHWINIRDGEDGPLDLTGELADVAAEFTRLPLRRLVILGAAGAGKSVLALRLARALFDADEVERGVPVVLSLASWNVAQQGPWAWAARQLADHYPEIGRSDTERDAVARALLGSGRVLVVLDGFDEMPEGGRGEALRQLNAGLGPGRGLVLTSRPTAYADAVADADVLTGAAVVQLQPLGVAQLAEFLPRTTRRTGRHEQTATKWDPVLERLAAEERDRPAARLRAALATPLMVGLARAAYSDTDADPMELLDSRRFPDRQAIERHLLDAYVPAVYRIPLDDRGARGPWQAEDAGRWLAFLARHLRATGTQELSWWRLELAHPAVVGAIPAVLGLLLLTGALYGTGAGRAVADGSLPGPLWLLFGLLALPAALLCWASQPREPLPGPRRLTFPWGWRPWRPIESLTAPADIGAATGPRAVLRDDRVASLTTGVFRVAEGDHSSWTLPVILLVSFTAFWISWRTHGLDWGYEPNPTDSAVLIVCGCVAFVLCGATRTAWARYALARCWLAATGRLPWRCHAFLEDAHRRGVLRQSGGVYQFRHLELRDRLAGEGEPEGGAKDPHVLFDIGGWVGQMLLVAGLFAWGGYAPGTVPAAAGPHSAPPPACTLLSDGELRPVMSRPEKMSRAQLDTDDKRACGWWETGPGRDALLRLTVLRQAPRGGVSAVRMAENQVQDGKARPLPGVADSASWEAEKTPEFGEGGYQATVRARSGNVWLTLTYREELADRERVLSIGAILAQQVLHNAEIADPPRRRLAAIPLPKPPADSRFARYRAVDTRPVVGDEVWKGNERSQLYGARELPFAFRGPRLDCSQEFGTPVRWSCGPGTRTQDEPVYAGQEIAIEDCGPTICSKAKVNRFAKAFRWYADKHASDWKYLDESTQYNHATFPVKPDKDWPGLKKVYGVQLLRHMKVGGTHYLLAFRAYADAAHADLPRKTLGDVCAQTTPSV